MRRAKIVCTLGPATSVPGGVRALVDAGMDVARINRSHGSYAEHEAAFAEVRKATNESGRAVGVLVDLQGPKIRTGRFAHGPVTLVNGERFTITVDDIPGDQERVSTTYKGLPGDVSPGDVLLIDDGKVLLRAVEVTDTDVVTEVVEGGLVSNHKGLNLPGVAVSVPAMSDKDEADLRWGLRAGADLIALSFVRSAADVEDVRRIMDEDGIMVARGDLGVELPLEQVPMVQKRAVELARRAAKPVIVATQVLDSMMQLPRPTRAEASDCANAVLDGADAIMLSGETSVGKYPLEAVRTMARIILTTEEQAFDKIQPLGTRPSTKGGAITYAAATAGELLDVNYLVAFTQSGDSARRMSRLRSRIPLVAFTPEASVRLQLALTWGVETFLTAAVESTDEMISQVDEQLLSSGRCLPGDRVVVVAGSPPGVPGSLNTMRIHTLHGPAGAIL